MVGGVELADRYDRRGKASAEALSRPTWLVPVVKFLEVTQKTRSTGAESMDGIDYDVAAQLKPLSILASSLKLRSPEDVEVLDAMRKAVIRFWSSMGYQDGRRLGIRSDAAWFADEVVEWLGKGIAVGTISDFLIGLMAVVELDATSSRFWLESRGGEIVPLEHTQDRVVSDDLAYGLWQRNKTGYGIVVDEKTVTLENLGDFMQRLTEELKRAAKAESGKGYVDQLVRLGQVAEFGDRFFKVLGREGRGVLEVSRPSSFWNVVPPIALALAEGFLSGAIAEDDKIDILAGQVVHAMRRRRISLSKTQVIGFCAAFRERERVDMKALSNLLSEPIANDLVGKGFGIVREVLGELGGGGAVAETIEKLLPEIVLRLRERGLHDFEWTREEYRVLKIEDQWDVHAKKIADQEAQLPSSWTDVQPGDVVIEWHGQQEPTSVAHEELWSELIGELTSGEFALGNSRLRERRGRGWLGIRLNKGNPAKHKPSEGVSEIDLEDRTRWARRALRGADPRRFFIYPSPPKGEGTNTTYLSMMHHQELFASRGVLNAIVIKVVGTDKLESVDGDSEAEKIVYRSQERQGDRLQKEFAHIVTLQMSDINRQDTLFENLRRIFACFPAGVVVWVVPFPEVHSSYFRSSLIDDSISLEAFSTLMHPGNIKEAKQVFKAREKMATRK